MPLTRDSIPRIVELVDEAKLRVQEARTATDEETRKKKLEEADEAVRAIERILKGKETA